jgi:hypothetical protein
MKRAIDGKIDMTYTTALARKQTMRYENPSSGEWIQPVRRGYRLMCCDCGLVHRVDYRIIKYAGGRRIKMQFRVYRDNRATAQARRKLPNV